MLGFRAKGASPIVKGKIVLTPKTIATAIKIGNPASWDGALIARKESKGVIEAVSDAQIIEAYKFLAGAEGVFAEPASAASIAGLFMLNKSGFFNKLKKGKKKITIVCTLTGHGLKDPQIAIKNVNPPPVVKADIKSVLRAAKI